MPLEQIGNALTFEAFYTDSGAGALGLTVTVDVWELTAGGVATEIVAGGAVTEMGDGLYYYQLAAGSVDAEAIYTAVFKTADACDQAHIVAGWVVGPTWVENVDAATATRATQADILSDATPFAGANVDAAISTRATQAQILSDATPFAGANVDGTISGIPDAVLSRDVANVEDTASDNSLAELLLGTFESKLDTDTDTWTIYKTDHITIFAVRNVVSDANAKPLVEVS